MVEPEQGDMGLINIDDIEVGMVLASDLRTVQGRLLLPKGTRFTTQHLKVCRIWGVTEAEIQDTDEQEARRARLEDYPPELVARAKKIVAFRFKLTDIRNPVTAEMARQAVLHEATALAMGKGGEGVPTVPDPGDGDDPPGPPPNLAQYGSKDLELVSLPDICNRIIEALRSPKSSASFLASIVGNDQNLSLKVLKIVNSPFYGLVAKVDTLSRAVAILGVDQLLTISLSLSMIQTFEGIPPTLVNMRSFWKHSIACGLASKLMAKHLRLPEPERFFLMGLLHDVGKLVMFKLFPKHALAALMRSRHKESPGYVTENVLWGFNHASLLERLLTEWGFPASLVETVPYHHKPEDSRVPAEAAVVHVADFMVNAIGIGDGGSAFVPPLSTVAWKELGLSKNAFGVLVQKLDFHLAEVMGVFFE